MSTPLIGDKFPTQADVKPSRPVNREQAQTSPTQVNDTVQLSNAATDAVPPSEAIQSPDQARAVLEQLLGQIADSPDQALAAQGQPKLGGLLSA